MNGKLASSYDGLFLQGEMRLDLCYPEAKRMQRASMGITLASFCVFCNECTLFPEFLIY